MAAKWYRHGLICQKLMRDTEVDIDLTAGQKRDAIERLSEKTCKTSEGRDKAIERLKIDGNATDDPWVAYDAHIARQKALALSADTTEATSANHASNAIVGVQDGGAA